jgi:hypothetical protein
MNGTAPRDALRRTLRRSLGVILPSDAETSLLRCLLLSGDEGRRAWLAWCAIVGNPLTAFRGERLGQKSLLPLLHTAVERNSLTVAAAVASWLRAAYFREQLRGNAYRRILDETVTALGVAGAMPVVLKGCALSDTVYPDPGTRHSHGIELLVRDDDLEKVIASLPRLGFSAVKRNKARRPGPVLLSWRHSAGLPLEIRTRLFDIPRYTAGIKAVWQRARPLPGHAALQLCPEDALLHVCGNAAMSGSRISLRWACDAQFLLQHHAAFDWSTFLYNVEEMRLGLPLNGILRYLAEALQAPIPANVIDRLDVLADTTDDAGYEVAAMGALVASHSRMRRMIIAGPDWRSRYILARRLLAPSPECVREMGWVAGEQWLVAYYLRRPLEYAALRIARLAARRPPPVLSRPTGSQ